MAETTGKPGFLVGVDLGGAKILAGVFTTSLGLQGKAKFSTKAQRGPAVVIERVARCVRDAVDEADLSMKDIAGVGVGVPGAVEGGSGNVMFAPNLNWRDVSFRRELENLIGLPVFVENDCNMATLGVYVAELKSKPRNMLGIFLGTGIGAGMVVEGELYTGFGHTAGEVGHMVIDIDGPQCGCGNKGCFEAMASRTAMFQRIRSAIREGQKTVLTEMIEKVDEMRSGDLRKACRRGDKLVERVVEDAAQYTGIAVANLVNVLNPEVVVLGGGIMEALSDEMLGIIVETAGDYAMPGALKDVEIMTSSLGDLAGIVGGAVLAKRSLK